MTTTSDKITHKIFIYLDSILETHLGTAARINREAAVEILNNGYYKRDSFDLWEYTELFDESTFKEVWNNRDIETLKSSVVRLTLTFIKNLIFTKTLDYLDRGGDLEVEVIINVFPYQINENLKDYIGEIIRGIISAEIKVSFVNFDITELTPKYLHEREILTLVLNDFNVWLSIHIEELNVNRFPRLEVYVPMISKRLSERLQKSIVLGEIDKGIASRISPYRATEITLAELVSLNYLPIDIFSVPLLN